MGDSGVAGSPPVLTGSLRARHSVASGRYGRYVGRVGALAVALGVGVAMSTGQGIGIARADETNSSTDSKPVDTPSQPSSPSAADQTGVPSPPVSSSSDPDTGDTEHEPSDSAMNVQSSGGVDTSVNDEGQSTDTEAGSGETEPDVTDGDSVGVTVTTPVVIASPTPEVSPGSENLPSQNDSASHSGADAVRRDGAAGTGPQRFEAPDASSSSASTTDAVGSRLSAAPVTDPVHRTTFADSGVDSAVSVLAQEPAPQVQESLAGLPGALVSVAGTLVAVLLSPFLAPGPATPAEPPLLWAVLGWVRREITRTFFNQTPHAAPDPVTTSEDTPKVIDVLGNDVDDAGDHLTVTGVSQPANGTVVVNPDGTLTYTPRANFFGADTFTYTVSDADSPFHIHGLLSLFTGQRHTATGTVTVTVTAVNDAPVVGNDTASVAEGAATTVTVLANDVDNDGNSTIDPTSLVVTQPAHGTVTANSDGTVTYQSDGDEVTTDSFTYTVKDSSGATSNVATVNVAVIAVNDAPVAVGDSYTTDEDTPLTVGGPGVLANDTDADSVTLTAVLVSGPTRGTLSLNPDGSFTYTPAANQSGPDSFTYKASDGTIGSAIATVNITVGGVNDAPVVVNDGYTVDEDSTVSGNWFDNDSDLDGDTVQIVGIMSPGSLHGSLEIDWEDGSFTYTPAPDFFGVETFSYVVTDSGGAVSNTATVTITVRPVADAPRAEIRGWEVAEDTTYTGALDTTDVDGETLTYVLVENGSKGNVVLNPDGTFSYTPGADLNGTDQFTYTVTDPTGLTATGGVRMFIRSVNDVPVAGADSYTTSEDSPLTVAGPGVLANDTDVESPALSAVLVAGPSKGTVTLNANGSFTYTPNADANGTDTFTYRASDGTAASAITTVTITVNAVSDAPVANPDTFTTLEDTALAFSPAQVLANDTDADGDPLTTNSYSVDARYGTLVAVGGDVVFTPAADFHGTAVFDYAVVDGTGRSSTGHVTVNVTSVNDAAPAAVNDFYLTAEDRTLTVGGAGVLANDTDVDNGPMTAVLVSNPSHGSVTLNPNGSFVYTPAADHNGSDTFTYQVFDGTALSEVKSVSIIIDAVPDNPVANADTFTTLEDTAITITAAQLLANDRHPDGAGESLSVSEVTGATNGTVVQNPDGTYTYTPNANYFGTSTLDYRIVDGNGAISSVATVTIHVTPVNERPVAVPDNLTTRVNTPIELNSILIANDTDPDGDPVRIRTVFMTASQGSITFQGTTYVYTPPTDQTGQFSFSYTVTDDIGGSESPRATVNVTVY